MAIQFNYKKLLANLFKYLLGLALIAGLAWGGYELFMSWSNIPFNVRVTNITARSATVSWLTDRPSKGSVAYSDSEEMGILNYQALTAYDDRDMANALTAVLDEMDLSVDEVDFPDVSNVTVSKKGEYYVHHVTVTGLEPEEEYFFSVKSGIRFWTEDTVGIDLNRNSQGVINELDFKTTAALDSVPAPSPAYGKIISLGENENGELIERDSLDAVVFYRVEDMTDVDGRESGLLSSVTNETGGWYIDRANLKYADNETFDLDLGNDMAYIFSNVENIRKGYDYMLITGVDDAPAPDVLGNGAVEEEVSALSEILISLESVVSAGNPPDGCNTDVCYNGSYWKEIGGQCKKAKTCKATKPGEGAGDSTRYVGDDGGVAVKPGGCYPGALGYGSRTARDGKTTNCTGIGDGIVYRADDCSLSCSPGGGSSDPGGSGASDQVCCLLGREGATMAPASVCESSGRKMPAEACIGSAPGSVTCCVAGVTTSIDNETACTIRGGELGACVGGSDLSDPEVKDYTCPSDSPLGKRGILVADPSDCCSEAFVCRGDGSWTGACNTAAGYRYQSGGGYSTCGRPIGHTSGSDDIEVEVDNGNICCSASASDGKAATYTNKTKKDLRSSADCTNVKMLELFDDGWIITKVSTLSRSSCVKGAASVRGISTATATTTDDGIVIFPESGIYEIDLEGEKIEVIAFEGMENTFYREQNGIPGFQEDGDTKFTYAGVSMSVSKKVSSQTLSFKEGVNLVSFPFMPMSLGDTNLTAKQFAGLANLTGMSISSISFFESGAWASGISVDFTEADGSRGRDFDLLPGRGYVVIAEKDFSIDVPGKDLKAAVPISLSAGWNLPGINGYTTTFTARTLIESINGIDGLTADNVTWWPTSKGRYEGFQVSEGTEYGFDYPISNDLGYFIRISDFSPETPSTKSIIWGPGTDLHGQPGSN